MFIYEPRQPENPTFAPNFDSAEKDDNAAKLLWDATRNLQIYRDNANAEAEARTEAYDRRNRAIFEATGVKLENPWAASDTPDYENAEADFADPRGALQRREREWTEQVSTLARERPEHAGVIAADRSIQDDAYAITRAAETEFAAASEGAAGLGFVRRGANMVGGGALGMVRDPLQVASLFAGGFAGPARTVSGRILSMMFTEAAVNAGVEGAVQIASQDYKRRAGVEHGVGDALKQVGIAALFGGGFGGLLQGGAEVLRLTGKSVPDEILRRAAQGTPEPGDTKLIAEALGLQLDPDMAKVADLAAEQSSLDRAAFGQPPAGIEDGAADALAARTIRSLEDPVDAVPDPQARYEALERIAREQQPVGPAPQKPVSLMQFLSSRSVGGIVDHGGELAAMGLSRKFVPGGGALVRKKGKPLDMAREAAAEAGYFDDLYGNPDRATAESTVDDLLRLLRQEAGGEPVYSPRNDGGRQFEQMEFAQRERAQEGYRNLIGRIDSAAQTFGLDGIDDAIIVRAAQLVDNETDEIAALERALDEDYRSYADAAAERGDEAYDDSDIPFFEDSFENAGPGPRAGEPDGNARAEGGTGGRGADAPDGQQFPRAGGDEGSPPLRAAGDTPEPGTPEAGDLAETTLLEARGSDGSASGKSPPEDGSSVRLLREPSPTLEIRDAAGAGKSASEPTAAGEQALIEGVKPVTTKERLDAKAAKPLRGGEKAPPEGGLFDDGARQQIDMWDAMPAGRTADGEVSHVTHAQLVDDADRDDFFGDLIASCKD